MPGWQILTIIPGLLFLIQMMMTTSGVAILVTLVASGICIWRYRELIKIHEDRAINQTRPEAEKPHPIIWNDVRRNVCAEYPFLSDVFSGWIEELRSAQINAVFHAYPVIRPEIDAQDSVLNSLSRELFQKPNALVLKLSRVTSLDSFEQMIVPQVLQSSELLIRVLLDCAPAPDVEEALAEILSTGHYRIQDAGSPHHLRRICFNKILLCLEACSKEEIPESWLHRSGNVIDIRKPTRLELAHAVAAHLGIMSRTQGVHLEWIQPELLFREVQDYGTRGMSEIIERTIRKYQPQVKRAQSSGKKRFRLDAA